MRRRGYLWCSARTERAANCRDVRTCKSAVEKRNCKCMGRTRERKLKFVCKIAKIDRGSLCDFTVAPHAGAWVEIIAQRASQRGYESPPTRGRGLKYPNVSQYEEERTSPPTRGRGLKSSKACPCPPLMVASPPTRGRGLKSGKADQSDERHQVAPHAGAWVEIKDKTVNSPKEHSRPPRGGVG